MKTIDEPNAVLVFQGQLMRVRGIGEGKTLHLVAIDAEPCPTCGRVEEVSVLEHSPLFQESAEAVNTIQNG